MDKSGPRRAVANEITILDVTINVDVAKIDNDYVNQDIREGEMVVPINN